MSVWTNRESVEAVPPHAPGAAVREGARASAEPQAPAAPKPKTKRPRPTFEDGSLTRVFKFPSKTYPRSSYYVTGDEIIIRIRKAKKRWKLVIPKKRVVAYRTNRWFAKPRWVEIELTVTQATRLGLVARVTRPAAGDAGVDTPPVESTLASHDRVVEDTATAVGAEDSEAPESVFELGPDSSEGDGDEPGSPTFDEPLGVQEATTAAQSLMPGIQVPGPVDQDETVGKSDELLAVSARQQEAQGDKDPAVLIAECPEAVTATDPPPQAELGACSTTPDRAAGEPEAPAEPEPPRGGPRPPDAQARVAVPTIVMEAATIVAAAPEAPTHTVPEGNDAASAPVLTVPAVPLAAEPEIEAPFTQRGPHVTQECGPLPSTRRGIQVALTMTLCVMLVGASAVWLTLARDKHADGPALAQVAPAATSADPQVLVTGSIERVGEPKPPEPVLPASAEPQAPQVPESAPPQLLPRPETASSVRDAAKPETVALVRPQDTPPQESTPDKEPAAESIVAPTQLIRSEDATDRACTSLRVAAEATRIQFEFASATLSDAVLTALEDFARRLPNCTRASVVIEGHADSDGDADRNQAVSVRRAQAVRDHLIAAGASSARLSIIGYGHLRPSVPNDTPENKQRNRRAVLVLDLPR